MNPLYFGAFSLVVMLALIVFGVPLGISMAVVGVAGTWYLVGFPSALDQIITTFWNQGTSFELLCIPLFIFMGQLIFYSGLVSRLYETTRAWVGHVPGGLAIATVFACGGFGAVTGSSGAATATMGSAILPELKKYKYDDALAAGTLTSGGGLAALIPPSVIMVFYGLLTDTSIGGLFMGGILPGIVLIIIYCTMIYARCVRNPELGPRGPIFSWKERFLALSFTWPIGVVALIVIGGIYGGIFTPTEAAGIGSISVTAIALFKKVLSWETFKKATNETGLLSAMVFLIIVGGFIIARFLAVTEVTKSLVDGISNYHPNKYAFIYMLLALYLVLGCILDTFGMLILTLPFAYPTASILGWDPVWLGIFIVMVAEMGLVTPPVGINVYILHSVAPSIPLKTVFSGSIWFFACMILMTVILIHCPELVTWLPSKMIGH